MTDKNAASSTVRPSMSVEPANTKNLRSKFEQLQHVASTGNASRNKRGFTLNSKDEPFGAGNRGTNEFLKPRGPANGTDGTPTLNKTASSGSLNKSPSSDGGSAPKSTFSPATKSSITAQPKPANPGPSFTTASKISTQPVQQMKPQIPSKATIPLVSKPIVPVPEEKLGELEMEDSAQRQKPKQKPKPDPARKTLQFNKSPIDSASIPAVAAIPEKKEEERSVTSSRRPSQPTYDEMMAEIGSKWRIKYDELEFDELVSAGSAGEVYMGYYYGTAVAIKKLFTLPPDQKHLVAREFAMLTEVNHPNIVQFLGICDHDTGIYLITEYIEHGDLFDLLIFGGQPISWKTKTKIAIQVAQAVYYLHSRKIIHRDLKSQNVLIGENMKVKLCDLGLATVMEAAKRMTVCGTNEWMAPEILLQDNYDEKVDVFSFGIVLTELVTCQPPKKRDIGSMLKFDVEGFMKDLPDGCPSEFAQLVVDCCKFKPEERPTIKDIVARLRKLQNEQDED